MNQDERTEVIKEKYKGKTQVPPWAKFLISKGATSRQIEEFMCMPRKERQIRLKELRKKLK